MFAALLTVLCAAPSADAVAVWAEGKAGGELEQAVGELSSWRVVQVPSPSLSACDARCLAAAMQRAQVSHAFVQQGAKVLLFVDGAPAGQKVNVSAKAAVDALLPPYARRGYGALQVPPEVSRLKLDGVVREAAGRLPVTAGVHDVDVVWGDRPAVLGRLRIEEGSRLGLEFAAQPPPAPARERYARRYLAYGLFGTGALGVAGGFLVGALANGAAASARRCTGQERTCTSFADAQALQARSQGYAQGANVLLVGGAVLAAAGAGVFAWDAVAAP